MSVRRHPHSGYFLLLAAVSGVLALGPTWNPGQPDAFPLPFRWLFENVPGFGSIREPSRFGALGLLGIDVLAGFGVAAFWGRTSAWVAGRRRLVLTTLLVGLLSAGMLGEFRTGSVHTRPVRLGPDRVAAYEWLAQRPDGGPLIEFPTAPYSPDVTLAMLGSTLHWHPLFHGQRGLIPEAHVRFLHRFPGPVPHLDSYNIGMLQDLGVRYALFDSSRYKNRYEEESWQMVAETLEQLQAQGLIRQVAEFGRIRMVEILAVTRLKARVEFLAPTVAQAGVPLGGIIATRNDNANLAVVHSGWLPRLRVRWADGAGHSALEQDLASDIPSVVDAGIRATKFEIPVPRRPGNYLLRLTAEDLPVAAPLEQRVLVADTIPAALPGPALGLEVDWERRGYRPGEEVQLALRWTVRALVDGDYQAFARLLGPNGANAGRRDGEPVNGLRPTSRWLTGEVIEERWSLSIPQDARPGIYHLLLGLYRPESPAERLPLLAPDGTTTTELTAGAIEVLPP